MPQQRAISGGKSGFRNPVAAVADFSGSDAKFGFRSRFFAEIDEIRVMVPRNPTADSCDCALANWG
jgi:hypothetical protein